MAEFLTSRVDKPCTVCARMTKHLDVAFMAAFCSVECQDEFNEDYYLDWEYYDVETTGEDWRLDW